VSTAFMLSASPTPPASLVLMINGLVQLAYAFSGQQVIFETPPHAGDVISAVYQI